MADYATLANVKAMLGDLDSSHDAELTALITRASAVVDLLSGRRFDSYAATKYFDGNRDRILPVPDLVSVTTVRLRDTSLDTSTWRTVPAGDVLLGPTTRDTATTPARWLRLSRNITGADYRWPFGEKVIEIAGTWGWPAVPADVVQATIDLTLHLWRRRGSGDADIGIPDLSQPVFTRALPALAYRILERYSRRGLLH